MRLNDILEISRIEELTKDLPESGFKLNKIHCSDSEILDLGISGSLTAITMDTIVEEVESGLYTDPFQIGWMVVVANLSDLAAVGAQPMGMLLSHTIPESWNDDQIKGLVNGVRSSSGSHGCPIIGGDLNLGSPSFTGVGIGSVDKESMMSRVGCSKGDLIYTTAPPGLGTAYAVSELVLKGRLGDLEYFPKARLKEGGLISKYATSCMDTSDGLISALDHLARINNISIDLNSDIPLNNDCNKIKEYLGLPPLTFTFGIHGDFELVYTIPKKLEKQFLLDSNKHGYDPLKIGSCLGDIGQNGIFCNDALLPSEKIRNLWDISDSMEEYAFELITLVGEIFIDD